MEKKEKAFGISTNIDPRTQNMKQGTNDLQIPKLITEHARKGSCYSAVRTISQLILENPNTSSLQKRTKSAPDELRMQRTSTTKHDLLEEQPKKLFFIHIKPNTMFLYRSWEFDARQRDRI